jgi:hypothetical protein
MKKLKVFKDFEKDIFFAPALGNSVTRFDPVDRAKCFYWERERTLCFTYPEIGEVFNSYKILCDFSDSKSQRYDYKVSLNRSFLKSFIRDTLPKFWNDSIYTKFARLIEFKDQKPSTKVFNKFPYNTGFFPNESYLNIDLNLREDWSCPLSAFEFKNITRKSPVTVLREPFLNDDIWDHSNVYREWTYYGKKTIRRPKSDDKDKKPFSCSSKVGVKIFIDPECSEGTLEKALKYHVRLIIKKALAKKTKAEKKGIIFSNSSEYVETRELNSINTCLNFLGHYRLLECEKWSWGEVANAFKERESNKKNTDMHSVRPMSYEHYKNCIKKVFPIFKFSNHI